MSGFNLWLSSGHRIHAWHTGTGDVWIDADTYGDSGARASTFEAVQIALGILQLALPDGEYRTARTTVMTSPSIAAEVEQLRKMAADDARG